MGRLRALVVAGAGLALCTVLGQSEVEQDAPEGRCEATEDVSLLQVQAHSSSLAGGPGGVAAGSGEASSVDSGALGSAQGYPAAGDGDADDLIMSRSEEDGQGEQEGQGIHMFIDDTLWKAFPFVTQPSEAIPPGPFVSEASKRNYDSSCELNFSRQRLLHLFEHPRFVPEDLQPHKNQDSTQLHSVAVSFTDMTSGCPTHYGHLVENVALSLFKHLVDNAQQTWSSLGLHEPRERPTIYVSNVIEMVDKLQALLPTLEIRAVPWVPQFCDAAEHAATFTNDCSGMPQHLVGKLPLLHLSSDGFPRIMFPKIFDEMSTVANDQGWGFLARNTVVLEALQGTAQRFQAYLHRSVCNPKDAAMNRPHVLMVQRRPGLGDGNGGLALDPVAEEHDRILTDFDDLVASAKKLVSMEGDPHGLDVTPTTLEDTTLKDQCHLFGRARVLVAQHGAALVNCIFMPKGAKVLEIAAPSRAMVKFWCSDLLAYQHHRLLPTSDKESGRTGHGDDIAVNGQLVPTERTEARVDLGRFQRALRFVLVNQVPTGVGEAGVANHLLGFMTGMVRSSPRRYGDDARVNEVCARESDKAQKAGAVTASGRRHLLLVSGIAGSGTRPMTAVMDSLPQVVVGPVSSVDDASEMKVGIGADSAAVWVPNYLHDQLLFSAVYAGAHGLGWDKQASPSALLELDKEQPILDYLQKGVCHTIRAIWAWQDKCLPGVGTHALLKEPLLEILMPFLLASNHECTFEHGGSPSDTTAKFVHVLRDPRIHHLPHKAIGLYDSIFEAPDKQRHEATLHQMFGLDLDSEVPGAFEMADTPGAPSTAGNLMKFALVWQWLSVGLHRYWSWNRADDYFPVRVEEVSPPTSPEQIHETYQRMLRVLELPHPGGEAMAQMVSAYRPVASVEKEPRQKVQIIEAFAADGLREFGYM